MIPADELHAAVGNVIVRILRADEFVVLDLQSVFFPAAGISYDVKKWQMALRAIRELNFVHVLSSLILLFDCRFKFYKESQIDSNDVTFAVNLRSTFAKSLSVFRR